MVYNQLKPQHPNLSMGTVYRNLNLLADEGVLIRMPFSVERYDATMEPHSHFRCNCCTRVLDLDLPYDVTLDETVHAVNGYHVTGHALIFEGTCPECLERQKIAE